MKSEKQYNHIEDKITAAANAAEYTYNEASWKKMEALLDKQKDRRKPFFWIFGFILSGAFVLGGQLIYQSISINKQPVNTAKLNKQVTEENNDKQPVKPINNSNDIKQTVLPAENTLNNNTVTANGNTTTNIDIINAANKNWDKINTNKIKIAKQPAAFDYSQIAKTDGKKSRLKKDKEKNNTDTDNYNAVNKNIYTGSNKFSVNIKTPDQENDVQNEADVKPINYLSNTNETKKDSAFSDLTKNKTINKPDTAAKKENLSTKTTDKKDKKKKQFSGFYVFGAMGAEANSTKLFSYKNSIVTPVYGLGLGYQLNSHFSIQAGFYASAKKYMAGPDDYNVKDGSYLNTVKIIKVDANCRVYQIPVVLQYNWLIKPRANYYAAIGVSSYIMKKENYNYTFERNNYQYSYPYDYTKNSHLFASMQLSLGIEKQIGRKLFIQAAPIVNIPLRGVGDGSVKIFTTGLHVGIKYLPFKH